MTWGNRDLRSYSSTIDIRDVMSDWSARWATVLQQARYGELGGVASRHYSECREHPELLATYLEEAFPIHALLENDPNVRALAKHGLVVYICPAKHWTLILDTVDGVWARRGY